MDKETPDAFEFNWKIIVVLVIIAIVLINWNPRVEEIGQAIYNLIH